MKHKLLFLILFFTNCIYSQFDNLKNNSNELEAKYIKNQLFVKIKDEIDFNPINSIEPREFSNKIKITKAFKLIELQKIYLVEVLDSSITTDSVIRFFTKNEAVEYVERVPLYELFWTPNDPMYLQQWNLQKIQADLAWNISQGKQQIRVAITDDGFLMNHEDLTSKWFINSAENPTNGIDDDNNGYIDDWRGWDAADNDNNPAAFNPSNNYFDHGTHVAGITTVATNNAKGIAGIGGNILLIPVKIGANSNASFTGAYQGVEYAIIANANVINMSWGGGAFSQTYQNLFNVAKSKNIVCVAAAGNSSTSSWMYPASYQNVISVASTTNTDALSWFSNFGSAIDVCAPGSDILSCHATGITNYTNMSGTSMAAPLVSGLCGLMLSHNLMPADSIEACLKRTSNNINANNPNRIGQIGAGRINAFQALQCVTKNPISSFDILDTFQCSGQLVRYQATSNGAQPLTYQWIFPGGSPSTSTFANPGVIYSSAGLKSATLITCNTLGCDTITKTNIVRIDTPSAWLTGRKYTTYNSNPAVIAVNFKGNPPYNVTLTDGTNTWTENNITANPYFFSIVPQLNTSLISIQSFSAKNCIGKVSKQDTIEKNDLNAVTMRDTCIFLNNFPMVVEDAGISSFTPNTNYALHPEYGALSWTCGGSPCQGRSLMKFNLNEIPQNAIINDATLYLTAENPSNGYSNQPTFGTNNASAIKRITQSWSENTVTWNNQPTTTTLNQVTLPQSSSSKQNYVVNMTQLINDSRANPNNSHGFMLQHLAEPTWYNCMLFASTDFVDISKRPKLKICYSYPIQNNNDNNCDTTNLNVGRVLHLDFNGNTQDKSGNNNHATNFGATPVAGKNGVANTAYRFDGINDYMKVNHHTSLNMTNITLTAVLKPNGFYNGTCYGNQIIKKGNTDFVSGEYGLVYSPNGYTNSCFVFDTIHQNYAGYVFNNRPSPNLNNTSPYVIKGQWDCLVYTKNNDSTKFYINGVLKYATASNSHGSNLDDIFIGKLNNWQYPYWLNADIDDIRIYNRVLSALEVKGYCGSCNISSPIEKACSKGFKQTIPKCTQETLILNSSNGTKHLWSPKLGLSNDTNQNPICSINQNTTYYSTKIDSVGCQIVDTFIIQIRAVSKFEPISDTLICIGDSATINIKNRTNPIWSPNTHIRAFGTNDFKLFPNQSTDYILNYQDTFGCSFKDTISIKTKICCSLRAQFEMSKTNLCFGDSLMVNNSSSSISGVSFSWSIQPNSVSMANYNGIQPPTLFFENAGDYTIELIGDNGSCKDTFVKTILVTKLNPNAGNDTFYCGNALQYQLGESPIRGFKYSWNPPTGLNNPSQSNPILSLANQKIDYILQMEDTLSGCRFYDTVTVSAFNFKNFSKIIDTLICDRDSIMVLLPSFTKSATWKNAIHISDSLSKQPLLFPKDTQRYIVHFEDSNRCQYQDTFDLFTKICCEHIPHFLVAKNTICFGETLQITENSTYKTPVNHKWKVIPNTVSPSFSSGKTPPNFQFLDSGKYQIWLTIYDSYCIDSFLREVKVVRIYPNAGLDQSSCRLQNNFSLGFPPVDGYQYVWTPSLYLSNPFISNPTASVFRDSIRYILETRDIASQCVFNYAVDIKTKRVIDSSITFDTLCEKSTLDFHGNILNASGFYDTILSDVLNTCDSIYKATHLFIYPRKDSLWTQQYGCKYFQYKNTVFEKDTFLLDSIFNSKGCLVSILQIPIEILNTTIEDSTIIACGSYLHNGLLLTESYKRIKTNRVPFFRRPTCDSVWRNIGLNILPAPKAIIEPNNKNNPIPYGTKLNLEGKGGDFYQWNFENSTEKSIVYEAFQDYRFTLVVSLQNECKDTATYFVKVGEIPDGKIVFPNAFSPNGDQVNDYFKPNSYQFGALVSLSIFNRWGEKIFENFNQDAYWDGTYKNEIQPSGVYIYIATFKSPKGELKTIKGDFLLVR